MADTAPVPFGALPIQERAQHVEVAARAYFGQGATDNVDEAALRRVAEIEEEIALMAAFNGFDSLRYAEAQEPHFVAEVRAYVRGKKQAEQQQG